jgi:hypothetical protein
MKKIVFLISFLLCFFVVFSQNIENTYRTISEYCGNDVSLKFITKQNDIKTASGGKDEIKILVLPITNKLNEQTVISQNISSTFANILQQKIKSQFLNFDKVIVSYSEKPDNSYDFFLSANYVILENKFVIENILFTVQYNKNQVALEASECVINTNDLIIYDYALVAENISQLSRSLVIQMKKNTGLTKVKLQNFVNIENNLPSGFSDRLATYLESDFSTIAGIEVQRSQTRSLNATTQYEVSGTYNVEGDKIKVIAVLRDPANNTTKASATAYIKLDFLTANNIEFKPQNVQQFNERKEVLTKTEVKDDFKIDIWTNKGNENPIFKEGDILKITVQADLECYIRVIDVFADGTQILLLDNYKIEASQVGNPYEIPIAFQCSEPFGAETLIVMAQTGDKLPFLQTVDYYGYRKIIEDIKKTRAFGPAVLKAEKYVNLITIKK